MTTTMSIAISAPTSSILHSSSSSSTRKISSLCSFSNSAVSIPKNAIVHHIKCVPLLGLTPFSQWNGLRSSGVSISQCSVKLESKGKCKGKGKGVFASLFGVGAPEVLVIGVVALLVFGPKGLAEVARNLGKTLRAFQPTIRELQEVSREFKSTLEREIGLDDIDPVPKSSNSNTTEPTAGTNIEPNGSSSETAEDPVDSSLKMRADQFKGALAQLQKEQAEERQKKEEEQLQAQLESQATTQDASEAPVTSSETVDTTEETTSVTPPSENLNSNVLQGAGTVVPTGSAANTETQS